MKNYFLLSALFLVLCAACKKKEEQPKPRPELHELTDFLYLPVKDAEWRVHLQNFEQWHGGPCRDITDGDNDTAAHRYYTIKSTGTDSIILERRYYRYLVTMEEEYTKQSCISQRQVKGQWTMFLREDTIGKKIFWYDGVYNGSLSEEVVVDFSSEETGEDAKVSPLWPASYVSGMNNIIINGQKAKNWDVMYRDNKFLKFFYKGYGIGNQVGVLPPYFLNFSEPISLDFTYKGQTNHFDFELHP
jgi:hypothetical protein